MKFGDLLNRLYREVRTYSHSARPPRTMSGRPSLGPYASCPDVLIRRGRSKDVVSTSRPSFALRTLGRPETYIWAQIRSHFQHHVKMRRTMDDPCRVGYITVT